MTPVEGIAIWLSHILLPSSSTDFIDTFVHMNEHVRTATDHKYTKCKYLEVS